jgi:N-acetylglucosamine-6-sulfatase
MGGTARFTSMRYAGLISLIILLAVATGASAQEGSTSQISSGHPNIVFIVLDDASGNLLPRMPTIQSRMVKLGTRLPNSIYSVAWCGPSRASMLRGQYPHNHGVGVCKVGEETPARGGAWDLFRPLEDSTYATWLHDSGYRTGYIGKYMNGYNDTTAVPPGWDSWYGYLGDYGGGPTYRINENGTIRTYSRAAHDTNYMSIRAGQFIRAGKYAPAPWLLTVATNAPHVPNWIPKRHRTAFAKVRLPRSPAFNEADVSDKGSYVRGLPRLSAREVAAMDNRYRQRLRSMLSVDQMVGHVLDVLRETGQMPNTYIVLWNDNGYHLGTHRLREGKLFPYEEDVRYPLIVRGPNVPVGGVRPQLISNIDIASTFADIANVEPASFVDGRSILPLLSPSPPESWRSAVLMEFDGANHPAAPPPYVAVRTDNAKYIEWQGGDREFYNLPADPYELNGNPNAADPARVADLEQRLRALENCSGELCRAADGGG